LQQDNNRPQGQKEPEMTKRELAETEKEEFRQKLLKILKPGDTVFCILRHVSQSGMSRRISFYSSDGNGGLNWLDGYISKLLDYKRKIRGPEGLTVGGCGMDMGFAVVYELGSALWPNGDGKYTRHRNGNKGPEKDGGYFLNHKWL
jgi:hypothetical protein